MRYLIDIQDVIDLLQMNREEEYKKSLSSECEHKSVIRSKHDAHVAFCDYLIECVKQLPTHPTPSNMLDISVCVDKQAVIDQINRLINDKHHIKIGTSTFRDGVVDGYARVLSMVNKLPSVQPEPQWIPCGERLPEEYVDVLVWFEYYRFGEYNRMYSTYGIGDYDAEYDKWWINHESGWRDLHVFAWMPLPEPYKEDNNAD